MAGTTRNVRKTGMVQSDVEALAEELNKLVDDVETLRAALATHTHDGVTAGAAASGTPTPATITTVDTAADMTAAKLNVQV